MEQILFYLLLLKAVMLSALACGVLSADLYFVLLFTTEAAPKCGVYP